ncbi:hypothetical protein OF83DRAFT_1172739 [Amylostereum chailletii]|nr:hypothetical protein OF83DRAFT_1172739 [Amylostereum chailletii]
MNRCVASACLRVRQIEVPINRRPDHRLEAPRITQLIPVVSNGSLASHGPHSHGLTADSAPQRENFGIWVLEGEASHESQPRPLLLRMHGGYYVDKPQRAIVAFHCGQAEDPEPTYGWTWNGTHTFNWNTKHACASRQAKPPGRTPDEKDDAPPSNPSKPPAEDHTPSEDELLRDPITDRASSRTVLTILLCTFAGVFGLGYLLLRPPPPLRPYIHRILPRPLRRASESKLLRWAREDLPLLDEDEIGIDGEGDEMVNSHEAYGAYEEQIPLKPSPTRAGFVVNYGALGGGRSRDWDE